MRFFKFQRDRGGRGIAFLSIFRKWNKGRRTIRVQMLHLFIIPLFPIFGLENALSMTPYFTVQQSKYGRKTQNNKMVGPNENN